MIWYVEKNGSDSNKGTEKAPFLTISKAAQVAQAGDTVLVAAGIYREWVDPVNKGTEDQPIVFAAVPGAEVVITGAEAIADWQEENGIWKTVLPNDFFGDFNPYKEVIGGDWFFDHDKAFHTGEVYLNGKSMYEALDLEGVLNPKETENSGDKAASLLTWFVHTDQEHTTIWANFQGQDPRQELVEINVRPHVFWPRATGRDYITVRGFTLKQAATQWAPPTAFQGGLIGPHWSRGWVIEDNIISDSKNTGISLGKDISTGHNEWTNTGYKGGTQREREVIFRSLHHGGWTKENVGGHVVRNNVIKDCEQAAIVGHLGSAFCTIENNHIYHIHFKRQWHGAEVGGIKFHGALDTIISGNTIHDAYRGLWLDWQAQGTRVSNNVLYDNSAEDLMVEVCHGPYMVDNNVFLSPWSLKDMSTGGAFIHNLFLGKIAASAEPFRYTPYHFPHETAVYGVANILGGDNRFYNNVFLRDPEEAPATGRSNFWNGAVMMDGVPGNATFMQTPVGLSQYDAYPSPEEAAKTKTDFEAKLPVYVAGNLYLNGAEPYVREKNAAVFDSAGLSVEVSDRKSGKISVKVADLSQLAAPGCALVTTETLGLSYQAEMAFENPDGTPIAFDRDFFGKPRRAIAAGPFELTGKDDSSFIISPRNR